MNNTNSKQATKIASKMLCSVSSVQGKRFYSVSYFRKNLDFRYNQNRLIFSEICRLAKILDFSVISEKQKQRAQNRHFKPVLNILNSPLVVDYKANKNSIKYIDSDCIHFYGRNHWAKNDTDFKILSILKKHYSK